MDIGSIGNTADAALDLNLAALETVRGSLNIGSALTLESLARLATLEVIQGNLSISNTSLRTMADLAALSKLSGNLTLTNNRCLDAASITTLVARLAANGYVGTTSASGNGTASCP